MQRLSILFCSMIVIGGAVYSASAQAGILEFLFPSMKTVEYDPTENMIAPFAVEENAEGAAQGGADVVAKPKLKELPVNAIDLDKPHRLSKEIGMWIMTAAADAMNFEAGSAAAQVTSHAKMFDTAGEGQYTAFLRDKNILKVIEDGRYSVRSYVGEQPLLLNEGVVNGRYRWLFRVPVVVSYLDKNMKTYKNAPAPIVQQATLNVQIGRVQSDEDKPDGLQIEQWSGKVEPFQQK